jgi:hypothetical protein
VVIPAALMRELRRLAAGDAGAGMRMAATIAGLSTVVAGYFTGRARLTGRDRKPSRPPLVGNSLAPVRSATAAPEE